MLMLLFVMCGAAKSARETKQPPGPGLEANLKGDEFWVGSRWVGHPRHCLKNSDYVVVID